MGVGIGGHISHSRYDEPKVVERVVEKSLPNPDPKNFKIIKANQNGRFLLILINYPDCTNYEGNKILLYENTTIYDLIEQESIDPHFSNNPKKYSPVARFEPTDYGWELAEKLIRMIHHLEHP